MVTDALSAYPTRLEIDQEALARKEDPSLRPFSNRRHALIQVGREGGRAGGREGGEGGMITKS